MNPEEQKSEEIIENTQETNGQESVKEDGAVTEHWPEDESVSENNAKLKEEQEKYLRLYSEFENFRRRTAREKMDLMMTAGKDVIVSMLPILDDFERALKSVEPMRKENAAAIEGFELIFKKMLSGMEAMGLKAMDCKGKDFDVELHEAITKIQAGPENSGKVVDEAEKGYMMHDKVIRFAKVVVGE
ncbi:MAG: nucleotide exchange factor GrpE [Bacteroidetes bacterium]|nr:nucleotide exchange factor GrpE [Bacteroidota bacterium]